jgi:hypothetical protein
MHFQEMQLRMNMRTGMGGATVRSIHALDFYDLQTAAGRGRRVSIEAAGVIAAPWLESV